MHYDFNQPSRIVKLPKVLNEISGLQFISKNRLACVQDEKATVYFIDPKTGEIKNQLKFGKKGDFEGITLVNDVFYALRSDGRIYKLVSEKAQKFDFKKGSGFDFEGLCFDAKNNRLLVACKEHGDGKMNKTNIYIYLFCLKTERYDKKPLFVLPRKLVGGHFQPSGIAQGPDGLIYVLSGYSRQLMVINEAGELQELVKLDLKEFIQAEGICLGNKGELYISNEGRSKRGNIMMFKRKGKSS